MKKPGSLKVELLARVGDMEPRVIGEMTIPLNVTFDGTSMTVDVGQAMGEFEAALAGINAPQPGALQ